MALKKLVTKNGTIYISDSAVNGYTWEKINLIIEAERKGPLQKLPFDELKELYQKVFGVTISEKACKSCSRSKYPMKLIQYKEMGIRILTHKAKIEERKMAEEQQVDETQVDEPQTKVEETQEDEPQTEEQQVEDKPKKAKGGKK